MTRRVVVTGMAGLSPLGSIWEEVRGNLLAGRANIKVMPEWAEMEGLKTRLAAEVPNFERPSHYSRKQVRTMGRVGLLATRATELALEDAGLRDHQALRDGRTGIAYGSTSGSPPAFSWYAEQAGYHKTLSGVSGANYLKFMSHTCAANLGHFFGVKGRIIPTCSACTAGSQGIGYAYEAIKFGLQEVMIAGGAEELHVLATAVFDIICATSTRNDDPDGTPRPFDRDRDGLVPGEGAATLILESLEHAQARDANILAEISGFATNCDGTHIVHPSAEGMCAVMNQALSVAEINADQIDYVNAHATATTVGDITESMATAAVFGSQVPVSTQKGYMGHTLGACGSLEAWMSIHFLNEGWVPPNLNLENLDSRCANLDYVHEVRESNFTHVLSNNFAFGGINTAIVLKKWQG